MDVSGDPVSAFAALCERFRALCLEDPRPENERLWSLRALLGELIAGASALAGVAGPYDVRGGPETDASDGVTHERLGRRHPSLGFYWHVLETLPPDPPAEFPEPATALGDFIDDLLDILGDLLDGLSDLRAGRRAGAVGYWFFMFRIHWGAHAIGALGAIDAHLRASGWTPPAPR